MGRSCSSLSFMPETAQGILMKFGIGMNAKIYWKIVIMFHICQM
jgi:hypothetical protein